MDGLSPADKARTATEHVVLPAAFPSVEKTKTVPFAPRLHPTNVTAPVLPPKSIVTDQTASAAQYPEAPSPQTVVAGSRRRVIEAEEQVCAGEAKQRAEHAAEIERLTETLDFVRAAHAAEIERLRTEHAADLRRLVENLWRAQDAARDALENSGAVSKSARPAPMQTSWYRRTNLYGRLTRLVRRD